MSVNRRTRRWADFGRINSRTADVCRTNMVSSLQIILDNMIGASIWTLAASS